MNAPPRARDTLRSVFGFSGFRDGQEEVVGRLLAGRSVLAVFPTGGGKSLCYQLPALLLDGLTLVVSPLIALMKDQLDFLARQKVPAARLDSTLTLDEYRDTVAGVRAGRLKLLYVAPERLANERFLQTLRRLRVAMLAVDEAHCISEWGHNFRPDYLKLAKLAEELRVGRVLALTATATPEVARDIARAFRVAAGDVVRTGFYRPNLHLYVTPCRPAEKLRMLRARLDGRPAGATIVYVTLQRTAEWVAAQLAENGLDARAYHAGLAAEKRAAVQDWFMADPRAVVVATIAFGMGIDKSDIRYVYHYNLPKSLENYAQEIGRAGRDDLPSSCELFACGEDRVVLENFTYGDTPTADAVEGLVADVLGRGDVFDLSAAELSERYDIRPLVVETLLTYLELEGLITSTGPFYSEYRLQPLRTSAEICGRFDAARAAFLKRVFARLKKGRTWFTLDVVGAARALNEPRERLVAALSYLEEQGDLTLQATGSRQGYRRTASAADVRALGERMSARFAQREQRDVGRLHRVLHFAANKGCWSRYLLEYFGDVARPDCGHCGWCLGLRPGPLPGVSPARLGATEAALLRQLRAEGHAALAAPRQLARFLCGLSSPATVRGKLTKDKRFGTMAGAPFRQVLEWVEKS